MRCWLAGLTLVLAWAAPLVGNSLDRVYMPKIAIVGIFLLSGITLRMGSVLEDVTRWRCHLIIQSIAFVFIPAVVFGTTGWLPAGPIKYGIYMMAVLPITISSCVVFTGLAGGRTACALLNAVGGNLLGVFVSPLLLGLLIVKGNDTGAVNALGAISKLACLVLLPFVIGQLLGAGVPNLRAPVKKVERITSKVLILLIMLCAFSRSWERIAASNLSTLGTCFAYLAVLHLAVIAAVMGIIRTVKLPPTEAAAVFFCATQKTLSLGIPLAIAFFAEPLHGIVILPITFYHFFQLIIGTFLIPYWARRTAASPG